MPSNYALAWRSVVAGVSIGILAALFTGTLLVGYAILVLCVTIGLTWRKDEAPIFPFILTFQWFQVTSGYFFWIITGTLPTAYPAGDVDRAVQIALTGLFVLAVGIRLAGAMLPEQEAQEDTSQ